MKRQDLQKIGTVARQARAWKWLRKFATSKASKAFQEIARTRVFRAE